MNGKIKPDIEPLIVCAFVLHTTLSEHEAIEKFLKSLPETRIIYVRKCPRNQKLYIFRAKSNGEMDDGEF